MWKFVQLSQILQKNVEAKRAKVKICKSVWVICTRWNIKKNMRVLYQREIFLKSEFFCEQPKVGEDFGCDQFKIFVTKKWIKRLTSRLKKASRSFFCLKRFTRHSVTRFRWLMKSRKQDRKRKKSVFYSLPRFVRKNRQKKFPRKNTLPLLKIGQLWEKVEEKLWAENWHVKNPFIIF